ncbi:MAG: GtrA family protein [Lachnospiraceae bacterium]|jgi:putative flippase GtrA|nr:GtrA family protein [Lachnospiraceae bacterium]
MGGWIKKLVNAETVSYVVVGMLTTAVDWAVYTVLWAAGADYRVSTVVGWLAAVVFAFVANKWLVFRARSMSPVRVMGEFAAFVACRAGTGLLVLLGMMFFVGVCGFYEFASKAVMSVISLALNYVLSKLFVFRESRRSGTAHDVFRG